MEERSTPSARAPLEGRDVCTEDRWSDIDLILQLAPETDEPAVVEAWTRAIAEQYGLADILDVFSGGVRS